MFVCVQYQPSYFHERCADKNAMAGEFPANACFICSRSMSREDNIPFLVALLPRLRYAKRGREG